MTLRQVLDIIWQRWLLVTITTVLVLGAAIAYLQFSPKVYQSETILRFSTSATQVFDDKTGYGGIDLDLDPDLVTSPEVLRGAAEASGEPVPTLQAATKVKLIEGVRTNRLRVTSEGASPEQSQTRANAVAEAYVAHLQRQVDDAVAALEQGLAAADQERAAAVQQASLNPDDPVARQRLTAALSAHLDQTREIDALRASGAPATVMQVALPGEQTGTDPLTMLGISLVSGLLAGAGAALIREQFDDKLRSADEVEDEVRKPVLAEVALIPNRAARDMSLPVAGTAPSPFSESIRALRTSLHVLYPQRHSSIVITSPEPGNGKSFLSANLAVSMARGGRSVVLVGGDLRRPRLDAYFGVSGREGFAEALRSDASTEELERLLLPTQFDGLRLLTAGMNRHQPADLLAGDTLPRVIERLCALADVVLIDSPPVLALTDAAILGAQADGVVVVASVNATRKTNLRDTLRILSSNGAELAGVVANRARPTGVRGYGAYYDDKDEVSGHVDEPVSARRTESSPKTVAGKAVAARVEPARLRDAS